MTVRVGNFWESDEWVADLERRAYVFAYRLIGKDSAKYEGRDFWILANKLHGMTSEGVWGIMEYLHLAEHFTPGILESTVDEIHLTVPPQFPRQVEADSCVAWPEVLTPDEKTEFRKSFTRLDSGILVYDD